MKVIALSEIRTENGEYVEQTCLINPAHMVSAHRGILRKPGPQLLGTEHERELTSVSMLGSNPIFVNESVEEIASLITKLSESLLEHAQAAAIMQENSRKEERHTRSMIP